MTARRATFLGSKAFGLAVLRCLVDAASGCGWNVLHPRDDGDARSVRSEFEAFCGERGLPFECVGARNANACLVQGAADIVFVCGWYALIPPEVLCTGRFVGIHNSLLPRYRGGAPLVWALINGDRTVGSSLFAIGEGMDDGAVFGQVKVEAGPNDHVAEIAERIERAWIERLPALWRDIVTGTAPGNAQDPADATYCAQRRPEDGRIDWHWPARRIHDFVRAQSAPYPGAFTEGPSGRICIWQTEPFDAPAFATPGQIVMRSAHGPVIGCGDRSALAIVRASDDAGEEALGTLFPDYGMRL